MNTNNASQLRPEFNKTEFDTLHRWDLGWAILQPINLAKDKADEIELTKRFSNGQRALYYFWYLDAQVVNGGFIQFYWNGYESYLPLIQEGIKFIGDSALLNLLIKANEEYIKNKDKFKQQKTIDDWSPLYGNLKKFDEYDSEYYKIHDHTMDLLEQYIRLHSNDFVTLR